MLQKFSISIPFTDENNADYRLRDAVSMSEFTYNLPV